MPAPRGVFALLIVFIVGFATVAASLPPGGPADYPVWPPSVGLVVAEVVTGGASASDEYVEVANAGGADVDLDGCELVYVTASGATTTRKTSFAGPLPLAPGQHLLVANAAGIFGPLADATYSGGLAADGGVVALRRADGSVIDAVGWGTAANAYVEGAAAPAPPAKSSIERLPGGSGGNTQDTNDNFTDWFVQPNPIPQSLASRPVPAPSATPTLQSNPAEPTPELTDTPESPDATAPGPTDEPTGTPQPTGTTEATAQLTATPKSTPTRVATASPTPVPSTNMPPTTPTPVPASATPSATPPATPRAASTASARATESPAELEPIALARTQAAGTRVRVAGLVTVEPGLVGADDLVAIQDDSSGVFVRLPAAVDGLVIGCSVEVAGTLAAPYGQLEVRDVTSVALEARDTDPGAALADLADVGEGTEASLIAISGTVESVQTDSGRLTVTIGDGANSVRLLADPPAGLSRSDVARGDEVLATGIVGQRATAIGRLDGYRVWLRRPSDLEVLAPTTTAAPVAAPTPSPTPVHYDLASAIGTRGAAVDVEATTTATAGLLDIGSPTIVVDDGTAAVAVVLPAGADVPHVGMRVRVTGTVGTWESGPTVLASQVLVQGELQAVGPRPVAGPLDGSLEWQLVQVCGRVDRVTRAGSRWRADLTVDGHPVVVLGEPAAAITVATTAVGRLAAVTGIVRRSTSDSKAFQLLPRTVLDFHLGPAPDALGGAAVQRPAGSSGAASMSLSYAGAAPRSVGIDSLAAYLGRSATIAGLVTATTSGTVTIDDGTGEVRVGGHSAATAIEMLEPGDAIEVTGLVQSDDRGLIIEADPDSIIDLPGDSEDAGLTGDSLNGIVAAASTSTPAPSLAAAASIKRASATTAPPDGPAILAVVLVMLTLLTAALAVAGKGTWLRRTRLPAPFLRAAGAVRLVHQWLGLGHGRGQ
jgi:hypothetical protein